MAAAIQKILVATDFSTRSDRALRRASLLAHSVSAELVLLHVIDDDQPKPLQEVQQRVFDPSLLVSGFAWILIDARNREALLGSSPCFPVHFVPGAQADQGRSEWC